MYHDGQWGTICDENWSHDAADVVCKELGFSGALFATKKAYNDSEGSGPVRGFFLLFISLNTSNIQRVVKCLISSKSCFIVLIAQKKIRVFSLRRPRMHLYMRSRLFVPHSQSASQQVRQPKRMISMKTTRVACVLLCRTQLSCFFLFLNFYHNITSFTRHRNEMEAIQNGSLDSDDDIFLY